MAANLKQFFHVYCGKNKVQPVYTYEEEDGAFYCEVKFSDKESFP